MSYYSEAWKEMNGSPSIFLELADRQGQASFTIPVSIHNLNRDLLTLKVDQHWAHLADGAPTGLAGQLRLSLGGREPYRAKGKVAWVKDLGDDRPLYIGLELTQAEPEVRELLKRLLKDSTRDISQLWERWDQVRRELPLREEGGPIENYVLGLGLMFVGFALPLVGFKVHAGISYLLIILGSLACATKGVWSLKQKKVNILR